MKSSLHERLQRRHRRVRAKVKGTKDCPRLSVSRSLLHIQAQLIDDEARKTIIGLSDMSIKVKGTKKDRALFLGEEIAKQAKAKGITSVVFDRGGYKFHGRVKAIAEGARKGGLKF